MGGGPADPDRDPAGRAAPDRRGPRRASTPAPAGSDPEPLDPPTEPRSERENDERLLGDRPPHWG
jgi:hypothetical protein